MPTPRRRVSSHRSIPLATALALAALVPVTATAQEHEHDEGQAHAGHTHEGLHFTHPLFTESVSPDTKLRLDYGRLGSDPAENEAELEGELAFARWASLEAGVHYHLDDGELGDTHVLLKLASPALVNAGIHLGGGLEVGIPTGPEPEPGAHEHGESWEVAPFVNAGWTDGAWELVGWSVVAIPTDDAVREHAGTGLRFNTSALYRANPRVDAMLEAFGVTPLSGEEARPTTLHLAPGIRVRPAPGPLVLGAGAALPVAGEGEDVRVLVSLFYHF